MAESMFSIGTEVEVSLARGGVSDIWYGAVVIGKDGNNAFRVKCYKTDLKVTVDALHIRPCLPRLECKEFSLFGKVYVFCGYGWAKGVISRILEGGRYVVLFDRSNQEKEVSIGDMRPCLDWINGKWVIPKLIADASGSEAVVAIREESSRVSEARVIEPLSQVPKDLPLLMWFAGKKPPTMQDSGISEIASEDLAGSEKDNLPFKKCSPIWTTIESMDIFQEMPQKPHFKPLWETKESSREGAAIGHMVTFTTVADSATKFQMDDPENTIASHLETLSELETHGFEVDPIRDRLNKFLLIKEEKRKLAGKLQEIRTELEEHSIESSKIDEEVEEMDKKIKRLKMKLYFRKLAGVKIDTDIAAMESELDDTIQEAEEARRDFEKLAAAPLLS